MIPEKFLTLVQVLRDSDNLRAWFGALGHLPDAQRSAAIHIMAEQMRAGGEEAEMVNDVAALANPQLFAAVARTLRDLG